MKRINSILLGTFILGASLTGCTRENENDNPAPVKEDEEIEYNLNLRRNTANLPATDELGRKLPTFEEAGAERSEKFVGLFYWIWHTNFAKTVPYACNVSEIVKQYPDAADDYYHPAWGGVKLGTYWWGEPLFGFYRDNDTWLLRKHAEMLCEAGVDVIIFDCTNGTYTWDDSWKALCETFTKARADGVLTPQIAFMLPFAGGSDTRTSITNLYDNLYSKGLYSDLWFYWKGKPLIIAHTDGITDAESGTKLAKIADFFTFRQNIGVYHCTDMPLRDIRWGWLEIAPQNGWYSTGKGFEEVTVGVAQNWSKERGLTAMNAPGVFGRSYTDKNGHATDPDAVNWGLNFQEQWDRALELDPEFIFITGWNEWIMGRNEVWQGQPNGFPDQFNQEYSRDIEPMKGGHSDNYYWQMVSNIRKFKGMQKEVEASKASTDAEGWKDVAAVKTGFWGNAVKYSTFRNNAKKRNFEGWGGKNNINDNASYDIREARVAHDADNIYFFVNFSPLDVTSTCKMRLFIDSDRNHGTGWEGYDYMVDLTSDKKGFTLCRNVENKWNWKEGGAVENCTSRKNVITLKIPRKDISIPSGAFSLEFKWTDSISGKGKIEEFWTDGDAAPLGRFNYLYKGL